MRKRYFDDLNENVAFERCIDVLAKLIEKYAGRLSLCDIGYEYWAACYESPIVTLPFSFEECAIRYRSYHNHFEKNQKRRLDAVKNQIDSKTG